MSDKFTIDFLYSQIKIMDKYEEALCNHSIPDKKTKEQCWEDFKAGQLAATQNYADALYEIQDLQNGLANCQRAHLEKLVHDLKKRIAELETETKALKENSRWLARLTESSRKENEHLRQTLSVYAAKQRWISVSERLPEDTERMLAIVYDAFEDTTAISILQHYGDGDWFSWDSGRYVVTHWTPLPELPKECER